MQIIGGTYTKNFNKDEKELSWRVPLSSFLGGVYMTGYRPVRYVQAAHKPPVLELTL